MILFRKPSEAQIGPFLASQQALGFSYAAVGATASAPPAGYNVDRIRVHLGNGEGTFMAGKAALQRWEHFHLGWVETWPPRASLQVGYVVGVFAKSMGLWWLNACRIVYVIDESGPIMRYGFAYGTLPDHVETGEERFLVEWNRADDTVWYDLLAFSRPRHFLARLGYPWTRLAQARFRRHSAAAMVAAAKVAL